MIPLSLVGVGLQNGAERSQFCLPETALLAWQRNVLYTDNGIAVEPADLPEPPFFFFICKISPCSHLGFLDFLVGLTLREIKFLNIYITCGKTDMRKSIDGFASMVQSQYHLDPFSKSIFLFCGVKADRIKILLWEGDGFVLLYKRLESRRFRWPRTVAEVKPLTWELFTGLMYGLDIEQPTAIKHINPGKIY